MQLPMNYLNVDRLEDTLSHTNSLNVHAMESDDATKKEVFHKVCVLTGSGGTITQRGQRRQLVLGRDCVGSPLRRAQAQPKASQ